MRYVVQTATELNSLDPVTGHCRTVLGNKVTVPCQSISEANEIADGFNTIPGRRAWAGVEHYTEGGVKLVLSFEDCHAIAGVWLEIEREKRREFNLAAD